ncbi:T-cell receptor delta-chain VD1D2J1 region [Sigmodon hispidus]
MAPALIYRMILAMTVSLLFACNDVLCITLTQSSPDMTVATGSEVTLLCMYDGGSQNPDLFWYRKRQDLSFQFILYRDNTRFHDADFVQGRFSVKHSKAHRTFHLVISPVRLEDSATYYCASGSTVTQVLRKLVSKPLQHSSQWPPATGSHVTVCQASFSVSYLYSSLPFSSAPSEGVATAREDSGFQGTEHLSLWVHWAFVT